MSKQGIFIISLDFELHWGVMPRLTVEEYQKNLEGTRAGILRTLELFAEYNIHATWATVGFLFFDQKEDLLRSLPKKKPTYLHSKYNSYSIIENIGNEEENAPYHFAKSLIKKIQDHKGQEIATHTFSHYFCLEEEQTLEQFEADIKTAQEVAQLNGIELKSIVFPRNQFNTACIEVCKRHGIKVYRGNPEHYIYQPRKREEENNSIKARRLLDAYFNLSSQQVYQPKWKNGAIDIKASRFLRPYSPRLAWLNALKLRRIKKEMAHAAKQRKSYHLWWHPHNFGTFTKDNLRFLEAILIHYEKLKKQYDFLSLNMVEASEYYP